jgi:hypothetical protein
MKDTYVFPDRAFFRDLSRLIRCDGPDDASLQSPVIGDEGKTLENQPILGWRTSCKTGAIWPRSDAFR